MKNDREKLQLLANLMIEQSATAIMMVTDDLLYVFDAALEPEEIDFLLKMGGGNLRRSEIEGKMGLPKGEFDRLLGTPCWTRGISPSSSRSRAKTSPAST